MVNGRNKPDLRNRRTFTTSHPTNMVAPKFRPPPSKASVRSSEMAKSPGLGRRDRRLKKARFRSGRSLWANRR